MDWQQAGENGGKNNLRNQNHEWEDSRLHEQETTSKRGEVNIHIIKYNE